MATANSSDIFSIAAFDPSAITERFRVFAETGALQSKDAFAKLKTVAEDAQKTVEQTLQTAQVASVDLGLTAIDALRTHADNSLSHMEALLGVKSLAELFELQTSFLRSQAEVVIGQAKSMQDATRTLADSMAKPARDAAGKLAGAFKAA